MVERAQPGGSWHVPLAADWNAIGEATEWTQQQRLGQGGGSPRTVPLTDVVKLKNSSGANRREGEVLEIFGFLLTTVAQRQLWFDGATPNATRPFGLLRQATPTNALADAQISGACLALVNVTDAGHGYATVASGNVVLQSAVAGPVRILYKPSGTGEKTCGVVIGAGASAAGSSGLAIATLQSALAPTDATASVTSVEALGGGTAPSVGSPVNSLFKLAGKAGDYVLLAERASNGTWLVAQITHQAATLVLKHAGDGVFLKFNAGTSDVDGYVIGSSAIVSSGTAAYEMQFDPIICTG
jgi:hypothetical protein